MNINELNAALEILLSLLSHAEKLNLTQLHQQIQTTLSHLQYDYFAMGIVGEFNRGKSTVINALCGGVILPTDILPTTAAISRIRYSDNPSAMIIFKDGNLQNLHFNQLRDYITKLTEESLENANDIQEIIINYPVNFCQVNQAVLIDTPGLNDDNQMTDITLSILSECELIMMILLAEMPLTESELNFIKNYLLPLGLNRVIFVVNHFDHEVYGEESRSILNHIEQRLLDNLPGAKIPEKLHIYGLSAKKALVGRSSQNMQLLTESYLGNFDAELHQLIQAKRAIIQGHKLLFKIKVYTDEIVNDLTKNQIKSP